MDLKKIITDAHMAGQKNQSGCDPSWSEAHAYYAYFIKAERSAMCEADSNAVLGEGWRDAKEKPVPQKIGVKCDKFVICDLNKDEYMGYYFYEECRWSRNGDDTQKILKWYRVPPSFA